jgi:hypothetical protein
MRRPGPVLRCFVFSLVLSACGEAAIPAPVDGGLDAALPRSELFGACVSDSQCPGEGAVCRRDDAGYPGGYCTVPCEDRTPCDAYGAYHHCVQREGETQRYCEQRCLNGLDCGRSAYTCAGELPPSGGVCLGICSRDSQCSEGHECEPYSGRCLPAGTAPTTGALTGDPCESDDACRSGVCLEETGGTAPNGWIGGSCLASCIMPAGYNSNTFFDGPLLPQGTCAGAGICFPDGSLTEGDLGVCLQGCGSAADCREGFDCRMTFALSRGSATFENGVCLPIDCSRAACPSGYTCRRVSRSDGSVSNICGR